MAATWGFFGFSLEEREDDGEASDAQALNEQIDVAWDGLNNFSNKLTYISTSQDVTHAWPSQQLKVLEADRSCTCSLEPLQKETLVVQPCRQRLRHWKLTCTRICTTDFIQGRWDRPVNQDKCWSGEAGPPQRHHERTEDPMRARPKGEANGPKRIQKD